LRSTINRGNVVGMTSTRRPATLADLTVGAIVYKGQGTTAYRVSLVVPWPDATGASAALVKATTAEGTIGRALTGCGALTVTP
jgi:hypothetical protein